MFSLHLKNQKKIFMKKTTLLFSLLFFVLCFQSINAQPWVDLLPKNKTHEELTLVDYQKAFNTYMASFNDDSEFTDNKIVRENGLEKFKRWEYYMEGVVDPETKAFPNKTGIQVVLEHKKKNPEVYANTPKTSNWNCLGPFFTEGGYAGIGRINCIAFHPTNPNIWWVGAASGGLWATINNGASWECLTDDNGVLAVSDIIIPTDYAISKIIYIATGDRDAGDNNSIGVLKSTDNGATWNETGLIFSIGEGRRVNRLLLDPNDNNTIIAATNVGVFKTTNGGATWNTQLSTQNFIDMEYKPGDFNILYGSNGFYANGSHIWRSTDGGINWTRVATINQQRTELAVTPANPDIVYAVTSTNSSGLYGVYKSINSGESFEKIAGYSPNMLGWNSDGSGSGGQGWYDLCVAVSPTNADVILLGGVNTWRSTNGGADWQIVNHWWGDGVQAVHADKHALVYRDDGILFEGNDGGVYISSNDGTYWINKTNGMRISQMYKLGCSATHPNEVITGLQDNGSKLFTNNNWRDVYGGDGMECLIDYSDVNTQYATIYYGNIYRTTDHWGWIDQINPRDDGAWVTPYIIHPSNPEILYAGYNDLWKTENRGDDWIKISTVNTSNKLRNIAICESNPEVIYMADETHIWSTEDGGGNWELIHTTGSITSLCVKNDDPKTLWYTCGGYNSISVFKSVDGGVEWINISSGLADIPAYSIVYNKLEKESEQLYVGTEVGVYFKNGEDDWVDFNNGFPKVKVGEIELFYDEENYEACRLRAATYGRGLWESPIYQTTLPVAGTITGQESICAYEVAQLYLIGFAGSVQWQESANMGTWSDIAGAIESFYQTPPLSQGRYYRVKVTLENICIYSHEHYVRTIPIPLTPTITKKGHTLISSASTGNQWYNQDGLIPGAIEKEFTPTENGSYFVIVTIEICSSELSNTIVIDDLSIGGNAIRDGLFLLFPNPTAEQLTITNEVLSINRIILMDILGKETLNVPQSNVFEATISLSGLPAGIYQVRIETEKGTFTSKVVKR
jgi:photosystem II stability/assembly factor-like uncharacterized protein